jgi:hypothetical protein
MRFLAFAPLLLMSAHALAMPCDTGYLCISASGKYKVEIQRCRYDNRFSNIVTLRISGKDVANATLGPGLRRR